jgi:hypothetical protein
MIDDDTLQVSCYYESGDDDDHVFFPISFLRTREDSDTQYEREAVLRITSKYNIRIACLLNKCETRALIDCGYQVCPFFERLLQKRERQRIDCTYCCAHILHRFFLINTYSISK